MEEEEEEMRKEYTSGDSDFEDQYIVPGRSDIPYNLLTDKEKDERMKLLWTTCVKKGKGSVRVLELF